MNFDGMSDDEVTAAFNERVDGLLDDWSLLGPDDPIQVRPIIDMLAEDAGRRDTVLVITVPGLEAASDELNPPPPELSEGDPLDPAGWWTRSLANVTFAECEREVHERGAPDDDVETRRVMNGLLKVLTLQQRGAVMVAVCAGEHAGLDDEAVDEAVCAARRAGVERSRAVIERAVALS